jgi:hypothetical protein
MRIHYRAWSAQRSWTPYRIIFPAMAGTVMLAASTQPWLIDPLGERFSAWTLPIDLGWQIQFGVFNYGLLSVACALYSFLLAFRAYKALQTELPAQNATSPRGFSSRNELTLAALLCLVPLGLFFLQYLFIDLTSITNLIQHQTQASLMKTHLGYGSATSLLAINPDTFDALDLYSRVAVVVNNLAPGLFLPLVSTFLLLISKTFWPKYTHNTVVVLRHRRIWWTLAGTLLLGIILGRGPSALFSTFQAQHLLATGDYTAALSWLDTAHTLNPSLDQLTSYHTLRGQAWYYLRPGEENEEAMLYLSSTYQAQKDYLSSYQTLLVAWYEYNKEPWLQAALSTTLTSLAEQSKPVTGAPTTLLNKDNPALPWLQQLVQFDPSNAYGHYMLSRIFYDEHNYTNSFSQMQSTLDLVQNTNFESIAYTYMGLNSEMLGQLSQARTFLFQAVDLDPGYRNNTARQELSGLR